MSKLTLEELSLVFRHGAGILNVHPSFDSIYRRGLAAVLDRLAEEADKGLRSTWPPYWAVWLRSIASEGKNQEPTLVPDIAKAKDALSSALTSELVVDERNEQARRCIVEALAALEGKR